MPTTPTKSQIKTQIEFLLARFFHDAKVPGAYAIGEELLRTGSCIVAGDGRIWNGGVGNFIRGVPAENAVGCTRLTLDTKSFLQWDQVRAVADARAKDIERQIEELQHDADALKALAEGKYPEPLFITPPCHSTQ